MTPRSQATHFLHIKKHLNNFKSLFQVKPRFCNSFQEKFMLIYAKTAENLQSTTFLTKNKLYMLFRSQISIGISILKYSKSLFLLKTLPQILGYLTLQKFISRLQKYFYSLNLIEMEKKIVVLSKIDGYKKLTLESIFSI